MELVANEVFRWDDAASLWVMASPGPGTGAVAHALADFGTPSAGGFVSDAAHESGHAGNPGEVGDRAFNDIAREVFMAGHTMFIGIGKPVDQKVDPLWVINDGARFHRDKIGWMEDVIVGDGQGSAE